MEFVGLEPTAQWEAMNHKNVLQVLTLKQSCSHSEREACCFTNCSILLNIQVTTVMILCFRHQLVCVKRGTIVKKNLPRLNLKMGCAPKDSIVQMEHHHPGLACQDFILIKEVSSRK